MPTLAEGFFASLSDSIAVTVVGMFIVFTTLFLIGEIFGWIQGMLRREEPVAPPPAARPAAAAPVKPKSNDHLIVVLTAAATAAFGQQVRVTKVRHLSPVDSQNWVYATRAGAHRHPAYRRDR